MDDVTLGYGVGSRWIDVTADKEYVCLDATDGAANWLETTVTAASGNDPDAVHVDVADEIAQITPKATPTVSDFLLIEDGLTGGELLIVSDPVPAITGTVVDAVDDAVLAATIARVASGEAELR